MQVSVPFLTYFPSRRRRPYLVRESQVPGRSLSGDSGWTPCRRPLSPGGGRHLFPWPDPNRHPRARGNANLTSPRCLCISPATGRVAGTKSGSCWTAALASVRKNTTQQARPAILAWKTSGSCKVWVCRSASAEEAGKEKQREYEGGLDLAGHHQLLPVLRSWGGKVPGMALSCVAEADAAIFVMGKGPEWTWELFFSSAHQCLPPGVSPELWRPLRWRRMELPFQKRGDAVILWKRRSGSAGWWWQPEKGSVVNTLEPRRSGIALPSRGSEISFLVRNLPSDRFLLQSPGFCSFSCDKRSTGLPRERWWAVVKCSVFFYLSKAPAVTRLSWYQLMVMLDFSFTADYRFLRSAHSPPSWWEMVV